MNVRTRVTIGIVLAVLIGLAVGFGLRVNEAIEARRAAAEPVTLERPRVRTEPLGHHEIVQNTRFTGTLRPVRRVDVMPEVIGRIEAVEVSVGDRVAAEQVLAVIEHRSLKLRTSQANAESSKADTAVRRARLDLEAAQRDLTRTEKLAGSAAVSQSQQDDASDRVRFAEAALDTALSQRQSARAAAEISGESLGDSRLFTPIAGIVTKRGVEVGTQVTPSQVAFEVQDIDTLVLDGAVPAAQYVHLRVGQRVEVTVDAYPGRVFPGEIWTLSPSLDRQTRRAAIEVRVENPKHELLANMFVRAQVTIAREQTLAVPTSSIVRSADGPAVFVLREGKAVRVPVPEPSDDTHVPAPEELVEGDAIIVAGQQNLVDGVEIELSGSSDAAS